MSIKYVHIRLIGRKTLEELVERAKKNDEKAFDKLILAMEKEMYLIAKTRLKNDDDIADAMQETILKCFRNLSKLKKGEFFRTWTIRILINECNKIYRKNEKYKVSFEEKEIEKYIGKEDTSDENISFELLIKNLDQEEKTILTLYYRAKYTIKEISKILKKNENTISSKMTRAKNKLRKQYKGEGR